MLVIVLAGPEEAHVADTNKPEPKTKVTRADIVVSGTPQKPYFCIHYQELDKDYVTVGFGSYCLDYVFMWRDQYLEIVEEVEDAPRGDETTADQVLDILNKMEMFQGQRAGRELWFDKRKEVQDSDLRAFNRDIDTIRKYVYARENIVDKAEGEQTPCGNDTQN